MTGSMISTSTPVNSFKIKVMNILFHEPLIQGFASDYYMEVFCCLLEKGSLGMIVLFTLQKLSVPKDVSYNTIIFEVLTLSPIVIRTRYSPLPYLVRSKVASDLFTLRFIIWTPNGLNIIIFSIMPSD